MPTTVEHIQQMRDRFSIKDGSLNAKFDLHTPRLESLSKMIAPVFVYHNATLNDPFTDLDTPTQRYLEARLAEHLGQPDLGNPDSLDHEMQRNRYAAYAVRRIPLRAAGNDYLAKLDALALDIVQGIPQERHKIVAESLPRLLREAEAEYTRFLKDQPKEARGR